MNVLKDLTLDAVRVLLEANDLPVSDLDQNKLEYFVGIGAEDVLIGLVGLELFPPVALLRSLVVSAQERGKGLGITLVKQIEIIAQEKNIKEIYLLTTTAKDFFLSLGYQIVSRELTPESIKQSSEFSSLCPASATVMHKVL